MNLTDSTAPSFKKNQIATTEGNKGHEWQPFVDFVSFCSKFTFGLVAVLLFGLATSVQAQFTYTTNNGTITITSYTGTGGDVIIPGAITGLPVTDIGTNAFQYSPLTSVMIPASVTNIGTNAFDGCPILTAITVDSNNLVYTSSNGVLFANNQTTLVQYPGGLGGAYTIPSTVTSIGGQAFFGSSSLTSITIPGSVIKLGAGVFEYCDALTALNVASNNPAYTSIGGVLFNKSATTLLQFPGGLSGSYNIPLGVTDIESNALAGSALFSIVIPDSVTNIGAYAFENCSLANVTIPNSVISIGDYAFYACYALTNVAFGNSVASIGNYAFSGPFLVGFGGFGYQCPPLTAVTIPSSVTNLGISAFTGCESLTAINIAPGNPAYSSVAGVLFNPNQTTLLEYPEGLGGSYTIPAGVITIESNAFSYSAVASVTMPDSVISIGDYAFFGSALTNVTMAEGLASIGAAAFSGWNVNGTVGGPGAPGPCPLTGITIPSSVTNIGPDAFAGCHELTNVTVLDGVTSIAPYAFEFCYNMTSVTIPGSVTSIGPYAFEYCARLTNAYFPGNAPDADSTVFSCDPLTAYYLPGTTGWAEFTTNTGVPTALWTLPYPLVLNGSSGVLNNQFGFTISWGTNVPVVVEACADLSNHVWTPIATNTLSVEGTSSFSDPQWTNYPARFYRLRSQ